MRGHLQSHFEIRCLHLPHARTFSGTSASAIRSDGLLGPRPQTLRRGSGATNHGISLGTCASHSGHWVKPRTTSNTRGRSSTSHPRSSRSCGVSHLAPSAPAPASAAISRPAPIVRERTRTPEPELRTRTPNPNSEPEPEPEPEPGTLNLNLEPEPGTPNPEPGTPNTINLNPEIPGKEFRRFLCAWRTQETS
jgi:hypothetical protein